MQSTGKEYKRSVKDFKLNTLLEITNAINNNLPEKQLFILLEYILKNQLSIGKAVIFLKQQDHWNVVLEYGVRKEDLLINIEEVLQKVRDITVLDTARDGTSGSFDVVIPVLHQSQVLAYLLLGDLDEDARQTSPIIKHLGFIQTLANITSVAVENQRLERENLMQERLLQELRMARQMQEMLLPKTLPNNNRVQIAAYYKPHSEVGGDFYDVIEIDENKTVFCIADISGKGMSAAILMANFQAHLRANLKVETNLERVMQNLNDVIWQNALGDRFVTCLLIKYDAQKNTLRYINAAHPAGVLMQGGRVVQMESSCVGLGMFDALPTVETKVINVRSGDKLICFTDGVTEIVNGAGVQFQERGLGQTIDKTIGLEAQETIDLMMAAINAFRENEPLNDDVALVSCRFV